MPSPIENPSSLDIAIRIDQLNYLEPPHLNTIGDRTNIVNILVRAVMRGLVDNTADILYFKLGSYKDDWGPLFFLLKSSNKDTVNKAVEEVREISKIISEDRKVVDNINSYWYLLTMYIAMYLGNEDNAIEDVEDGVTLAYNSLILFWNMYGTSSGELFGDMYFRQTGKTLEALLDESVKEAELIAERVESGPFEA